MRTVLRFTPAWRTTAIILVLALTAGGCSSRGSAADGRVQVVASFYPLAYAAERVGGSSVDVTDLTPPGVEPHDLELTPDQLRAIADADVVLYLGGGFQPAVEDALADASGQTVDLSQDLRTLPVPSGEAAAALTADPHVWLDPVLYAQIVDRVEQVLRDADPRQADAFGEDARAFRQELGDLDADFRAGLDTCDRNVIVTSHAAFGYLAARYGLRQEAIAGLSPEVEPSPRRLEELKQIVEQEGVTTIFFEELLSPKVAETLAQETGATTAVLSPLESLTPEELEAGDDYASVMRNSLAKLEAALGCH